MLYTFPYLAISDFSLSGARIGATDLPLSRFSLIGPTVASLAWRFDVQVTSALLLSEAIWAWLGVGIVSRIRTYKACYGYTT